jgi:hypothetical protein
MQKLQSTLVLNGCKRDPETQKSINRAAITGRKVSLDGCNCGNHCHKKALEDELELLRTQRKLATSEEARQYIEIQIANVNATIYDYVRGKI